MTVHVSREEWDVREFCFLIAAYLSGSILYARVFGRLLVHKDITAGTKDGNPGTANAFQHGGLMCGTLTLICELLKGFLPVWLYLRGRSPAECPAVFALILCVTPHFYQTVWTYISTSLLMLLIPAKTVWAGMLMISGTVLLRLHLSTEEREEMQVRILGFQMR